MIRNSTPTLNKVKSWERHARKYKYLYLVNKNWVRVRSFLSYLLPVQHRTLCGIRTICPAGQCSILWRLIQLYDKCQHLCVCAWVLHCRCTSQRGGSKLDPILEDPSSVLRKRKKMNHRCTAVWIEAFFKRVGSLDRTQFPSNAATLVESGEEIKLFVVTVGGGGFSDQPEHFLQFRLKKSDRQKQQSNSCLVTEVQSPVPWRDTCTQLPCIHKRMGPAVSWHVHSVPAYSRTPHLVPGSFTQELCEVQGRPDHQALITCVSTLFSLK